MKHICFSASGAATLRQVLKTVGRNEPVLRFFEDYSKGPVSDVTGDGRRNWSEDFYGEQHAALWADAARFWEEACDPAEPDATVWVSRRSSLESCGFLEWLSRQPDGYRFTICDFTDVVLPGQGPWHARHVIGTGILNPSQWQDGFRLLSRAIRTAYHGELRLWERLKAENAMLRVVDDGGLRSADDWHFDEGLLACIDREWRKAARVIGEYLGTAEWRSGYSNIGDLWLFRRLQVLAETAMIDMAGGTDMRHTEVRRKA